ncbi:MAG: hypothetical protein AAF806_00615 [Bacteroidota bacterium]
MSWLELCKNTKGSSLFLFLFFFVVVQILYHPLVDSGFVTDFTGLLERFENAQAVDILNSFGFPALQPVLNFFLYYFYQLFGIWGLPWYLIYSMVFTLNAFLLYLLMKEIGTQFHLQNASLPAFFAALLFIISPYQVEVLFWKVLFNFLAVTSFILLALLLTANYVKVSTPKYLLGIHICFLLGLFTFELALMLPLFTAVYIGILFLEQRDIQQLKYLFFRLLLPQFVMIVAWVILTKIVVGSYIGHYGASTHLQFDFYKVVGTFLKYVSKHFAFLRYLRVDDDAFYAQLEQPTVVFGFLFVLFGLTGLAVKKWKNIRPEWKLMILTFLWSGIALLPVLNLYFQTSLAIENDRYGYLAWAFFASFFVLLLYQFFPRYLFVSFFLVYAGFHIHFNQKTIHWIAQSTKIQYKLLKDFDYHEHSEIYLLGFVENLKGAYIFRDFTKDNRAFVDALKYIKRDAPRSKIYEVAQFNMVNPKDSLKATIDSVGRIQLTFAQWGNWWWRGGIGASSYETEKLKVEVKDLMLYITLKNPTEDALFLYQVGDHWQELKYQNPLPYRKIRPGPD